MTTSKPIGPHGQVDAADERERFALDLFDILWDRYRERVTYAAAYEQVVADAGAKFVNDHIAFRTFACQQPLTGISSISRIFEALGYVAAGNYDFPNKHLSAIHFQHSNPQFPKLFISELRTWELSPDARQRIQRSLTDHRTGLSSATLARLNSIAKSAATEGVELLRKTVGQFQELPWPIPEKDDVVALNEESQYAAWVLVHGYYVNHFTSLINSHNVDALSDIEKTVAAMKNAGIPMKDAIEGQARSKLRQTATQAVVVDVPVRDKNAETTMPWTYAYFELAERGDVPDPATGQQSRFEGFLGAQATHLFEMTRVSQ